MTAAGSTRQTVLDFADAPVDVCGTAQVCCSGLVKVTLRLSSDQASLLSHRARLAGLSQGSYVGGLLDGPVGAALADRRETLRALTRSSDLLSIISTDLNTLIRLIRGVESAQLAPFRARMQSIDADVRGHLAVASEVLALAGPVRRCTSPSLPKEASGLPADG